MARAQEIAMNSLRVQLLMWLLPLYTLSAVAVLGMNYLHYRNSIGAFMDGQMHRLALAYVKQLQYDSKVPEFTLLNREHVEHDGTVIVQFWSADGHLLSGTWPIPSLSLQREEGFRNVKLNGHRWRVYTAKPAALRVQVVQSGEFRHRVVLHSALEAAEPTAFLIPLTVLLLWLAIWFALRPLSQMVQVIAAQDERDLQQLSMKRVPVELRPLVNSMNTLFARLNDVFAAQRRFVQDAAHELRSPLTALKLQIEDIKPQIANGQVAWLEGGIERMQRLVEQLLKLARQEASVQTMNSSPIDIVQVLKQSVSDFLPLATARGIDLGLTALERTEVLADMGDLRGVFDNLLDNALRYTPAGGHVDVSLTHVGGTPQVEILDTGPGIPPELLERVFDRFYRVPGGGAEGSGLGLAIARSAANRAALRIELCNRSDRSGLSARVWFINV